MATALTSLAPERLAALGDAYEDAQAGKRRQLIAGAVVVALLTAGAGWVAEIRPLVFLENLPRFFGYFDRILVLDSGPAAGQRVWTDPTEWLWGLDKWLGLLGDTILIAYLGTLAGTIGGGLLCFAASANLMPNPWIRGGVRRFLEFCRTVPEIVFALIFVIAFGLGPLPGVLALAIHSTGALGKLYTEIVENIDMKPLDGAISTGASWTQSIRFAVMPQVLSNFTSYALLRFEINVRGAAVMGFVGAGGIGQDLIEAIRKFYYADVSAILLLVILTVALLDLLTERLRHALIGREQRP